MSKKRKFHPDPILLKFAEDLRKYESETKGTHSQEPPEPEERYYRNHTTYLERNQEIDSDEY